MIKIEELAHDIPLSELQRMTTRPATLVPEWPPHSGTSWVAHAVSNSDGGEAWTVVPPDYDTFAALVLRLPPTALWFLIPTRDLRETKHVPPDVSK